MSATLEITVDNLVGLQAAIAGGADRIELCSALALGGLTPSVGLMQAAASAPIPVYAMIRPRPGVFFYDEAEILVMLRDIEAAREARLDGVVFGAMTADGLLDQATLIRLVAAAGGMGCTLHRVIDCIQDILAAFALVMTLPIERVLTSGGALVAYQGIERLKQMQMLAGERLEIMAGSGITPENVIEIAKATGVSAFHASCSRPEASNDQIKLFGFDTKNPRQTDLHQVSALKRTLAQLNATRRGQ